MMTNRQPAGIPAVPLVSIIIPTLDEADYLPELLADLQRQRDIFLDIIVADGGSSDTTRSTVEAGGARFVATGRGRGTQMNAAAACAAGDYYLFLHADSRMDDFHLISNAVNALRNEIVVAGHARIAGHFRLCFIRSTNRNALAYRYLEEKSALNRTGTTNGDQGLLLTREFFRSLGGFDESLPFLEDQRIAERIRSLGNWTTLPGHLKTSARRFETEGFLRRYLLMGIMMGLHSIGAVSFFERAPAVYRVQREADRLALYPFFCIIRLMMRDDWGPGGTVRAFNRLGRYIRQNIWQIFFFMDVRLCLRGGAGHHHFLNFHDRIVAPVTNCMLVDAVAGLMGFIWYMGILAPWFRLLDGKEQIPR